MVADMTLLEIAERPDPAPVSRKRRGSRKSDDADFFAAYFRARPNLEISALELMNLRACLSFRTRISDLRFPPYDMDIRNRQETKEAANGSMVRRSFYRYVPSGERQE